MRRTVTALILFVLIAYSALAQAPAVPAYGSRTFFGGDVDFTTAEATLPFKIVSSAPSGACGAVGNRGWRQYGISLYACYLGAWTLYSTGGSGGGGPVDWADILNKPSTFTPAAHNHPQSDITGLASALSAKADSSALAGKADLIHSHAQSDITGLVAALAAKSDLGHGHTASNITDFATASRALFSAAARLTYNSSTGAFDLATTAVTPGTYPKVTVDAFGRITGGASLVSGDLPTHGHAAGDVTSGTFADARIPQSSVTQHQSALSIGAGQVASGTFADGRIAASNVTQHQAALAIGGAQITSGTIPAARIPLPTIGTRGGVEAKTCTGTDKISAIGTDGIAICSADQTSGGGSGITSLGTQTGATQTLSVSLADTNSLGWNSATNNHELRLPLATQAEAQGGIVTNKLMNPKLVADAIAALTPFPIASLGYMKNSGSVLSYQMYWAITPSSAALSAAGNAITCSRSLIDATPASALTLTSTPTILDGEDGQFCTIRNMSSTNALTLQDAANLSGSGLQFGGSNVTLAPRQSITLAFSSTLDAWTRAYEPPGVGGGSSGQIIKEVEFKQGCQYGVPFTSWNFFDAPGTAGVTPTSKCVYGANTIFGVLEFGADGEYVTGELRLPSGTVAVTAVISARSASTSGNMSWTLTNACVGTGEDLGTGTSDTPVGGPTLSNSNTITIAAHGTANRVVDSAETTLAYSGCAANKRMVLKLARANTTTVASPPQAISVVIRAKN